MRLMNPGSHIRTIGIWTSLSLALLSSGAVANIIVPPYILSLARNDAWVSVLAAVPAGLLWATGAWYVVKRLDGRSLESWLQQTLGSFFSWAFRLLAVLALFLQASTTMWETGHIAVRSYMANMPLLLIAGSMVLLCAFSAMSGLRAIGLTSVILIPIAIVLDALLLMLNRPNQDYRQLFPVLQHGYAPMLTGAGLALVSMMEIWTLIWMQQEVKGTFRWHHFAFSALFLAWLSLIPIISAITVFGPIEAVRLRNPVLEVWRVVSLGRTIEHIDLFAIVQRISSGFARISLEFYLMVRLLGFKSLQGRSWAMAAISAAVLAIAVWPIPDTAVIRYMTYVQYPFFLAGGVLMVSFLAAVLGWTGSGKKGNKETEAAES
ncbi:spore germination protein (amino acid permease) [Paenibacillus sp. RU4T]|nr:spore germination protein (amino acid permease) [Paenibacillus sp. RU4X]SIR58442.1 spore germination protein (amino acid permease) [Paenibacillus sp. RU4T]